MWIREDEICHFDDEVRCAKSSLYNRRLEQSHLIGTKGIKPIQAKEVKTVKPKLILRRNRQETVDSNDERYTVIRTWDNGGVWMGSKVESVLIKSRNSRQKPWWESVIKSQGTVKGDILKRGRGWRSVKA